MAEAKQLEMGVLLETYDIQVTCTSPHLIYIELSPGRQLFIKSFSLAAFIHDGSKRIWRHWCCSDIQELQRRHPDAEAAAAAQRCCRLPLDFWWQVCVLCLVPC